MASLRNLILLGWSRGQPCFRPAGVPPPPGRDARAASRAQPAWRRQRLAGSATRCGGCRVLPGPSQSRASGSPGGAWQAEGPGGHPSGVGALWELVQLGGLRLPEVLRLRGIRCSVRLSGDPASPGLVRYGLERSRWA